MHILWIESDKCFGNIKLTLIYFFTSKPPNFLFMSFSRRRFFDIKVFYKKIVNKREGGGGKRKSQPIICFLIIFLQFIGSLKVTILHLL